MKNLVLALIWLSLGVAVCHGGLFSRLPKLKFTLEVVDEGGHVVTGALAEIGMSGNNDGYDVLTDSRGSVTVDGEVDFFQMGGCVTKSGYYRTEFHIDAAPSIPDGVEVGRRLPPVTNRVTLRPIINPVPMYAYTYFGKLPAEETEVGFDFIQADWVAPHGLGVTNDLMIKIMTYTVAEDGIEGDEITWRFPRPGDGMVRVPREQQHEYSEYRLPRYAPENGYISSWTNRETRVNSRWTTVTDPPGQDFKKPSYFFRIRSMQDANGVVTNALYGKIIARGADGIEWSPVFRNRKSDVGFCFYVNPDGTRNMEFDPKRNLFREMDGVGKIDRRWFIDWP